MPKHARLVGRLAQIEVAGIGVDDRVLVGEIGDIELGEPVPAFRSQPEAQIGNAEYSGCRMRGKPLDPATCRSSHMSPLWAMSNCA